MESTPLWEAVIAAEAAVTTVCAALTAGFFFNTHRQAVSPGRRAAALALVLSAAGAAAQMALAAGWRTASPVVAGAGLTTCVGQALIALLVLRQIGRGQQ